jgi:glutamate-1-semialdehyde aminotransferase
MGDASLFRFLMTAGVPRTHRDTVEPAADRRLSRLFLYLLDASVLVGANGLGCLSTPMGEQEIDEIAEATARALHVLTREA